ncbi:hypothetical protein H6P81_015267 [Aristolochia fimbriata]|uniref:Pectinesterase catalytic domain-containing protein n=1 Tax=Aristolochia fimbriata TaxID=158543 RepID=A0AAV7E839_ARIFI|nr:hypothetical protein H6P81_015267 [Aristolochia fimbriata]
MPFELDIGGGYTIAIPDRINLGGASGYFIPIPHRRLLFSFIRGLVLIFIAAASIAYRKLYDNNSEKRPESFTVAGDGRGDFTTISAAVASAPDHSPSPFRIYIKTGVYAEHVKVGRAKTHLEFIGDGIDKTVIVFGLSEAELNRTYSAATVYVRGDDFIARDITFINNAGPHGGGAPTFTSEGNRTALYRCKFQAYRATVYASTWPPFSATVVMQSLLDELIDPHGWLLYMTNGPSGYTGEYDNRGPGAKRLKSTTLRHSANLTAQGAQNFTVAKLLHGDEWLPPTGISYMVGLM